MEQVERMEAGMTGSRDGLELDASVPEGVTILELLEIWGVYSFVGFVETVVIMRLVHEDINWRGLYHFTRS